MRNKTMLAKFYKQLQITGIKTVCTKLTKINKNKSYYKTIISLILRDTFYSLTPDLFHAFLNIFVGIKKIKISLKDINNLNEFCI